MSEFTLMQTAVHSAVTDYSDFVTKLSTFITAVGGDVVVRESQINKTWADLGGGVYGWAAGTDHYLELDNGNYQWRIRFTPINDIYRFYSFIFIGGTNYATNTSTWPHLQSANMLSGTGPPHPSCMPKENFKVWFFGSTDAVFMTWQMNLSYCLHFYIGRDVIVDSVNKANYATNGIFGGSHVHAPTSITHAETTTGISSPFRSFTREIVYNNILVGYQATSGVSIALTYQEGCINYNGIYNNASNVISTARMLIRNNIFIKDSADSLWYHYGWQHPAGFWDDSGLYTPGDTIKIGTEEFLCFPQKHLTNTSHLAKEWVAYRVS